MSLSKYRWVIFLVILVLAYVGALQSLNWYAFLALALMVWTLP